MNIYKHDEMYIVYESEPGRIEWDYSIKYEDFGHKCPLRINTLRMFYKPEDGTGKVQCRACGKELPVYIKNQMMLAALE
jgi:hypothetical protein